MNSVTISRRGLRLAAAAGALALGTLAFAVPATAAPEFGDLDVDRADATLTVHKHEFQAGTNDPPLVGDPDGGSALPNPIQGVTFTAYPISSLPLDVPSSWDALSALDPASAACPVPNAAGPAATVPGQTLGAGVTLGPTSAVGSATATLPVAAYLVCETAFTTGAGGANIDRPAQPFVVTIPFPDNQTGSPTNSNGWLYDVHAYPKNTRAVQVAKTVSKQAGLGLGETVSFPTTTGIPRIADDAVFTRYTVVDPMDPRLDPTDVASVTVDGAAVDADMYEVVRDRNVVMVQFTQAGLAWLKGQGGKSVVVVFEGTVASLASPGFGLGSGAIYNRARLVADHAPGANPPTVPPLPPLPPTDPGDPGKPVDPTDPFDPDVPAPPTVPSDVVTSNWGDIRLWKRDDQGGTNLGLDGAVFEVYEAATPYPAAPAACTTDIAAANDDPIPVVVGGTATTRFTSVDGVVSIPGLFVSDSENDPRDAATRCYVVREVVAPAGYVLPAGDAALSAIAVTIGETAMNATTGVGADATVDNLRQDVPNLPLTGAQGQAILMIVGGALLAVAIGTVIVAARRRGR